MYTSRSSLSKEPELEHPPVSDAQATVKSTSERGRWGKVAGARASEESPIAWESVPALRERLLRSLNIPSIVGIVAFAVVVLVTAAIMLRGLTASPDPALPEAQHVSSSGSLVESNGIATSEVVADDHEAVIFVHIVGEVTVSGVLELPEGARVADAIEAAGGTTPLAKLDAINLARILSDGEQVLIPDAETAATEGPLGMDGLPVAPLEGPAAGGKINLNTATSEQLQQLHRVGPALAQRIIDWRDTNGKFSSVDELLEVSGIGSKTLDHFRDLVGV